MSQKLSRLLAATVCACAVFMTAAVQAAPVVVYGNLGNSGTAALAPSGNASVSDVTWVAQGFTVGGTNNVLQSVTLGLYDNDSSSNTVARVQLFADASGVPGGSALATQTQTVGLSTPALQTFNFGSQTLTVGATYWIVLSTTESAGGFNWAFNNAGNFPAARNSSGWSYPDDGEAVIGTKQSTNSGSTWQDAGSLRSASISITAVPEPATWALAGVGVAAAGLMRWRRRRAAR